MTVPPPGTRVPERTLARSETIARADRLYRVEDWSDGYYSIDDGGQVCVHPWRGSEASVRLMDVVAGLEDRGVNGPLILRFSDIVEDRLRRLRTAFDDAIAELEFRGAYRCLYPIKVNQQKQVCEEVRDVARSLGFGLEVGSKPELLAALYLAHESDEMPIVCNGFKDREYLETVILAQKLGQKIYPVLETISEFRTLVDLARRYSVSPEFGVRVKLGLKGTGRWSHSVGERSKFGLGVSEIMGLLSLLRDEKLLEGLKLVHCHIGSQVPEIDCVAEAVTEVARIYAELRRLGAAVDLLDIGGGLAVDYDGARAARDSSVNYTLEEYASTVVWTVRSICEETGAEHPTILSESGRATMAHASALLFEILDSSAVQRERVPEINLEGSDAEAPRPLRELQHAQDLVVGSRPEEALHDARRAFEDLHALFRLGHLGLEHMAAGERIFRRVRQRFLENVQRNDDRAPGIVEEADVVADELSDVYLGNFSIFQSLPDSWALGQLFPILPIHRLEEPTNVNVTLVDLTCDSDGKIDSFIGPQGPRNTIEAHSLRLLPDGRVEPYWFGVFLVGAYQETLGDLHNLFGDTHVAHIRIDRAGEWIVEEIVDGDSAGEVLGYVGFDAREMRRSFRRRVERAVARRALTAREGRNLRLFYEGGLDGYTYLEPSPHPAGDSDRSADSRLH